MCEFADEFPVEAIFEGPVKYHFSFFFSFEVEIILIFKLIDECDLFWKHLSG